MTPLCALTCPRCGKDIPVGVLYGPCSDCRSKLNADAEADFARRLEVVADALAKGWTCDDARSAWVRPEPCAQCAGTGHLGGAKCKPCKGTGEVEAIEPWA